MHEKAITLPLSGLGNAAIKDQVAKKTTKRHSSLRYNINWTVSSCGRWPTMICGGFLSFIRAVETLRNLFAAAVERPLKRRLQSQRFHSNLEASVSDRSKSCSCCVLVVALRRNNTALLNSASHQPFASLRPHAFTGKSCGDRCEMLRWNKCERIETWQKEWKINNGRICRIEI